MFRLIEGPGRGRRKQVCRARSSATSGLRATWSSLWLGLDRDFNFDERRGVLVDERRQAEAHTPWDYLEQLSALTLLDRLPVPIVAVSADGGIVHANPAFEHMLGYESGAMSEILFPDLLVQRPAMEEGLAATLRTWAGRLVELWHEDESVVRAVISSSALRRADDPVALVAFHDVTDQLWSDGRITQSPYEHGGLEADARPT